MYDDSFSPANRKRRIEHAPDVQCCYVVLPIVLIGFKGINAPNVQKAIIANWFHNDAHNFLKRYNLCCITFTENNAVLLPELIDL